LLIKSFKQTLICSQKNKGAQLTEKQANNKQTNKQANNNDNNSNNNK